MTRSRLLGVATLAFTITLAIAAAGAEEIVVKARKVYTMTGPALEPGAVLISNGKIVRVENSLDAPEGATVVDLGAGIVMPGLIDAYSDTKLAGGTSEATREITPEFRVLDSIDWRSRTFRESLAEGITCVHVAPGSDNVIAGLACAVKTAGEPKHRIVSKETGLVITLASDPSSRNRARTRPDSIYVRQPTNRMGVVWMLRSTFHRTTRPDDEPNRSESDVAVARALAGKLRVFALSRTQYDMLSLLNLSREFGFAPTLIGGHEAYRIADRLAQTRTPVILAPVTTGSITGAEGTELFWNQPSKLLESGVKFALSGERLLEQAQFAHRFGLPADAVLHAVTTTPAKLLRLDKRIGSLAPGLDADLVALDGEPLEFATRLDWVMVNGKIFKQGN